MSLSKSIIAAGKAFKLCACRKLEFSKRIVIGAIQIRERCTARQFQLGKLVVRALQEGKRRLLTERERCKLIVIKSNVRKLGIR